MTNDYVTVTYDKIERKTEYARLFVFDGREIYIPDSQVFKHCEETRQIVIHEWRAIEEGIK